MPGSITRRAAGAVIAVAGEQQIPIGSFPRQAKYCCGYQKYKEETRFARQLREVSQAIVLGSAYVAGVAAVVVIEFYTNDDCDQREHGYRR